MNRPGKRSKGEMWQDEIRILSPAIKRCRDRRVAIDAGANLGHWTAMLSPLFTQVWAFEPVQATFDGLSKRFADDKRVVGMRVALHDHWGAVSMMAPRKRIADTARYMDEHAEGLPDTPCAPLDSFGLKHVDLLKIDVEGAELRALEGAKETIRRCRPVIVVEIVPRQLRRFGDDEQALLQFLSLRRYERVAWQAPNAVFVR